MWTNFSLSLGCSDLNIKSKYRRRHTCACTHTRRYHPWPLLISVNTSSWVFPGVWSTSLLSVTPPHLALDKNTPITNYQLLNVCACICVHSQFDLIFRGSCRLITLTLHFLQKAHSRPSISPSSALRRFANAQGCLVNWADMWMLQQCGIHGAFVSFRICVWSVFPDLKHKLRYKGWWECVVCASPRKQCIAHLPDIRPRNCRNIHSI